MKKDQILARMRENKGFITAEEVVAMHISRKTLIEMASEGMIKRIKPGLYALNDVVSDHFYNVIFKNPQAIFSHYTALYLQGYIEKISDMYDVTLPKDYRGSLRDNPNLNNYYVSKKYLEIGKTYITNSYDNKIPVYDLERCICDIIILNKDNELIKNLISKCDVDKVNYYAKLLDIEDIVHSYLVFI